MKKNNDIEIIQLKKELEECVDDIDSNLSIFEVIVSSVILDKNLPKVLSDLRKTIFDYIDNNDYKNISDEIILIDRIINDMYVNFRDILASDTYNDISGMDKMDNKFFLNLVLETLEQVNDIINHEDIKDNNVLRDDDRVVFLRRELNDIVMKSKMRGIISYDVPMDKINEVIEYVSSNFYMLHLTVIEPLFIENIKDINNVSYDKYVISMSKLPLFAYIKDIEDVMYAFLDEEGENKLKEIKDIIRNIYDSEKLKDIGIILEYLDSISKRFIRYEYPSVSIWKMMIVELLSIVADLMSGLSKDSNKDELIRLKEIYFNLKKKYYEMIFIGSSKDLIDIEKTERENLKLVRKV